MVDGLPKDALELDRFRRLRAETTDPLAARLLQDIIAELEARLVTPHEKTGSEPKRG